MTGACRALAVLGGLALTAGLVVATGTAEAGTTNPATPGTATTRTAAASGTVTLPTGDRYSVRHDGTGRTFVTPVTGSSGSFLRLRVAGDDYVVPATAFGRPGGLNPSRYDVSAALRGGAAPATIHPDFPMRTVTFNALDGQGQPVAAGLIAVVNVDDGLKYQGFLEVVGGVAKASVPDGHYSVLQFGESRDSTGAVTAMRIGFTDFTVDGGPTAVTVDGVRTATHQVTFGATPKPAGQTAHEVDVFRGSSRLAYLDLGATTTVGTPIYLGTTGAPIGLQHVQTDATYHSLDGTARPYTYNVLSQRDGAVTADQHHPISASGLATLDLRYHADAAGTSGLASMVALSPYAQVSGVPVDPVTLPLERTAYVTADPNVYLWGFAENDSTGETMASGLRSYRPGQVTAIDWNAGPDAPSLPTDTGTGHHYCLACRIGDTLLLYPSPLGDATPDHYSYDAPFGYQPTAHFQLYQGGTKLVDATGTNGARVAVGPDGAGYRLVLDNDRAGAALSTRSHTEWTFRSQHSGATTVPSTWDCDTNGNNNGCSALDLLAPHYTLAQSMTGTVPTGAQALALRIGHSTNLAGPAVDAATVSVSYDGGTTWTPAAVTAAGPGCYVATWTNAAATAGKHISFKVTATDSAGDTLAQTVTDAVAVVPAGVAPAGKDLP
jgi:hypothetical protein